MYPFHGCFLFLSVPLFTMVGISLAVDITDFQPPILAFFTYYCTAVYTFLPAVMLISLLMKTHAHSSVHAMYKMQIQKHI